MPKDPRNLEGREPSEQNFLRIIDEFGWHVMHVAPRAGEEGNLWSYSTGLFYHYQHPEIIILNQKTDLRHSMINGIGKRARAGEKFEPGCGYADIIDNFDVHFQPVDVSHFKDFVGWAIWFYDSDAASFPLLQCFYPDMNGKFPWEPDCETWAVESQPLLYKPKANNKVN